VSNIGDFSRNSIVIPFLGKLSLQISNQRIAHTTVFTRYISDKGLSIERISSVNQFGVKHEAFVTIWLYVEFNCLTVRHEVSPVQGGILIRNRMQIFAIHNLINEIAMLHSEDNLSEAILTKATTIDVF
jgi:hypothetical protein